VLLACGRGGGDRDLAVAWVDGEPITRADLEVELGLRGEAHTARFATPDERRELLESVIRRRVLAQRARSAGYDTDPELRAQLERILGERFERDQLRAHARELQVSPEEIEAVYRRDLERFTRPERVQVALIWIPVPAGATDDARARARARAEQAWREARDPSAAAGTFGVLALRYSSDFESRYRGGEIGWLERGDTDPRWGEAVVNAAFSLPETGDLSEVVTTASGFAIVKLLRREARRTASLDEVQDVIRGEIEADRRRRVLVKLRRESAGGARVELDERQLDLIPLFAPRAGSGSLPPG
jgi:parvulin-like peptidyl-prolyl isomerase